ncbi:MAG: VOC family protein [Pseudonocardiaceae bacterium]|nr:VOC family protein [Pseudonocardiaceae bacterium]
MSRIRDVVFDCRHPASLARFWSAVLDDYEVAPYDEAELNRLRSVGISDPEDDPSVLVEPVSGGGPRLFFNKVPESKAVKNRVHVDLESDDVAEDIQRFVSLGAKVLTKHEEGHTVLRDPEGNEFCVIH